METKRNVGLVKTAIEQYIFESINFDDESLDTLSSDWKLAKIYHGFKMEKLPKRHDLKRPTNEQEIFIDWLQGLPTNFGIEFRTFEQTELLDEWNLPYSDNRFDITDTFYHNVTKVFYDLLDQYNIN